MNKKIILFLISFLITATSIISQDKENIDPKGLSQEDMVRIFGDIYKPGKVFKTAGDPREIKEVIISGNKITTVIFNYGSITKPNYLPYIADLVWQGLGYGYEFGPLAAAQVIVTLPDGTPDTLEIVDDSYVLEAQGDYSPDGSLKWGWLPKPGFADPNSKEVATLNASDNNGDGKPDSWPERWYSPGAGKYLWPAFLGDQATAPDEEVYYVMDDYTNAEFPYYPFDNDSSKRGLGLDAEVRVLQYNNPLAEDIMFVIYSITNASDKDLPRVYFGMQGDPHVGGFSNYSDDRGFFIPPTGPLADPYPQRARSMVYAWDPDNSGDGGRVTGYFGWQFLESPTNSVNGEDDDDDGITDESPYNSAGIFLDENNVNQGITNLTHYIEVYGQPRPRWSGDEDGDWSIEFNDVGIDGIGPESANYPGIDYGEGDGKPSQAFYQDQNDNLKYDVGEPITDERLPGYLWAGSEPNFGLRDISESDQLGLTSFRAVGYTAGLPNVPKNDPLMWEWLASDSIDPAQELLNQPGDNIFNFGTGPLRLNQKETQRFSMSILFGDNLDDLVLNAETATRILESDYRFAKPPEKPNVTAVADSGKVYLYWDTYSEQSFDPFTRSNDFQGYKIYRSRDYTFADVYTITDANGVPFMGQPLFDQNTGRRAQFDLVDSLSGFHPIEYLGRAVKYYLGNNSGLVHEYVDSTVMDGITYYYAVVAYDAGSIKFGVPPSETQAVISKDPITSELIFDVNTVQVTPGKLAPGITSAQAGNGGLPERVSGNSTGDISVRVLNDLAVKNKIYKINFIEPDTYHILDSTGVEDEIVSKDTVFVDLDHPNVQEGSFQLLDANGNVVDPSAYIVNTMSGKIRGSAIGSLPPGQVYKAVYRYYPVYNSHLINGEDANDHFNGVRVYVQTDTLTLDQENTKFSNPAINVRDVAFFPPSIGSLTKYRTDWEIRWNDLDTTAAGQWANPGDTVQNHLGQTVVTPFSIVDVVSNQPATYIVYDSIPALRNNGKWDWGEPIILRPTGASGFTVSYEVVFRRPDSSASPVYPASGDIYFVKTLKPFQAGDTYVFETKEVGFEKASASAGLDEVYVVPNPYVAYSLSENPGATSNRRGEREIQFRNLPQTCTIRIYTIAGELVQTINKDDNSNQASWDLLSYEGQRIAYGVYLYHVDAPGVGEKIGRFAVIK